MRRAATASLGAVLLLALAAAWWRDPLTVQVVAAGYATASVPGVVPGSAVASPLRVLLARE